MTPEKKRWVVLVAVSVLLAGAVGFAIYKQHENIERMRQEAASLRVRIEADRKLIAGTEDLVKKVIIQRETDNVIKRILSDQEDVINLARTLQEFADDSGVSLSAVKKQQKNASRRGAAEEFQRVAYSLSFDATAFELLAFMNRVETHSRFMSITDFKVSSARGNLFEAETEPRHRVTLDLETYVYEPKVGVEEVEIDQYARRRDLLVSEISRRTSELQVPVYQYRGIRGRRDPFLDPRIPVSGGEFLSVEDQVAIVNELAERAAEAIALWEDVLEAQNLVEEMKARHVLEEHLAYLNEDIRRVEADGSLSFLPAQKRFENNVVGVLRDLTARMESSEQARPGPSRAALEETIESMKRHIDASEYELALDAFATLEPRLALAERDETRLDLVNELRSLKNIADVVIEFEGIILEIGGIAIYEGRRPVALINGEAVAEGEVLGEDLYIRSIHEDMIEFSYRGLVLGRRFE